MSPAELRERVVPGKRYSFEQRYRDGSDHAHVGEFQDIEDSPSTNETYICVAGIGGLCGSLVTRVTELP